MGYGARLSFRLQYRGTVQRYCFRRNLHGWVWFAFAFAGTIFGGACAPSVWTWGLMLSFDFLASIEIRFAQLAILVLVAIGVALDYRHSHASARCMLFEMRKRWLRKTIPVR